VSAEKCRCQKIPRECMEVTVIFGLPQYNNIYYDTDSVWDGEMLSIIVDLA